MLRRIAPLAVLMVLLSSAPPVMAGAGLPLIASLQVGPHKAALHNDSPGIRTGSNTLMVEIPDLPSGHEVTLHLVGPAGQEIKAPLEAVVRLGAEAGHGGHDAAPTSSNSSSHGSHGAAPATSSGHESHGAGSGDSFMARAKVNLPSAGHWKAILEINGGGESMTDTADFDATYGGPNKIYLGATGSLMGAFILMGIIQRRRPAGGR